MKTRKTKKNKESQRIQKFIDHFVEKLNQMANKEMADWKKK